MGRHRFRRAVDEHLALERMHLLDRLAAELARDELLDHAALERTRRAQRHCRDDVLEAVLGSSSKASGETQAAANQGWRIASRLDPPSNPARVVARRVWSTPQHVAAAASPVRRTPRIPARN